MRRKRRVFLKTSQSIIADQSRREQFFDLCMGGITDSARLLQRRSEFFRPEGQSDFTTHDGFLRRRSQLRRFATGRSALRTGTADRRASEPFSARRLRRDIFGRNFVGSTISQETVAGVLVHRSSMSSMISLQVASQSLMSVANLSLTMLRLSRVKFLMSATSSQEQRFSIS